MMGRSVIWVQLDGAAKFFFRSLPVPVVVLDDKGQGGVSVGEAIVDLQRAQRGRASIRCKFFLGQPAVTAEQSVAISQAGVGSCVVGISRSRLLKVRDGSA